MIRVGLIGLGFGSAVQLPAFLSIAGAQVVALGGQHPEKARELAAARGIAIGGSAEDVLGAKLDAVSIALPPATGATLALRALDQGLAVLSEKPLAESAPRAAALARAARDRTTAVDFELAEMDCFRELKRRIAAEPVERMRVTWNTRSFSHANRKWSWKTDARQHGGVMNLMGSHVFFLAEWLFGPLEVLSARFSCDNTLKFTPQGETPAEERALLEATFQNGASMQIELDNASGGAGQVWEVGPLVLAEQGGGALQLEDTRAEKILARDTPSKGVDWRIEPFRRLAARFVDCVARGVECEPGFGAGARVQRLIDLARESAVHDGSKLAVPSR